MTSEGSDERSESEPSESSSGERSEPRESDGPEERSDPRASDGPEERSDEGPSESGRDDDIPLNIAGHEDRKPPGERDASDPFGSAESEDTSGNDDSASDDGADTEERDQADAEDRDVDDEAEDDEEEKVEPVEVLVNLADEGEIDPWDVDVVRVTDKFLDVIDEADLRTSGRALFYASVLIRMKSDAMLADDEEEEEPAEPWEQAIAEDAPIDEPDPFASLEQEMDRRLERRRARGMPQTLDELVRDLRDAERDSWWKESRTYDTTDSPSGFRRGTQELDYRAAGDMRMDDEPTEDEVTGTTHAENMDEIVDEVYESLREHYEAGRDEVLYREIHMAGGSRVQTYLGLLFLAHRGRIRLQQDELFGDLWVQDPAAVTGSEEALAD